MAPRAQGQLAWKVDRLSWSNQHQVAVARAEQLKQPAAAPRQRHQWQLGGRGRLAERGYVEVDGDVVRAPRQGALRVCERAAIGP